MLNAGREPRHDRRAAREPDHRRRPADRRSELHAGLRNVGHVAERLRLRRAPRRAGGRPELPERRRTTTRRAARTPATRRRTTRPASSHRSARSRRRRPRKPRRSATRTPHSGGRTPHEAQAAVELADEENAYLNYQSFQQTEKAGFDVLNLAVSLSVSEIDPVNAVGALLNVVGDAVGFGFSGPDPNTLILQGIQTIAQQLSDFEQYTPGRVPGGRHAALEPLEPGRADRGADHPGAAAAHPARDPGRDAPELGRPSPVRGAVAVRAGRAQRPRHAGQPVHRLPAGQRHAAAPDPVRAGGRRAVPGRDQHRADPDAVDRADRVRRADRRQPASPARDPLTLDTNINLFNFFGAGVSDAPASVGCPGALTTHAARRTRTLASAFACPTRTSGPPPPGRSRSFCSRTRPT